MFVLGDSYIHRGDTVFRHGFRLGGVRVAHAFANTETIVAIDVIDPIGVPVPIPGKSGLIAFDDPAVAIALLLRQGDSKRLQPMFIPENLIEDLRAESVNISERFEQELLRYGAEPMAARRVALTVQSALEGSVHRPDHYGVKGWSPHLDVPFGLVMAGPWVEEPPEADPIAQIAQAPVDTRPENVPL
jgi:hypothetical protein